MLFAELMPPLYTHYWLPNTEWFLDGLKFSIMFQNITAPITQNNILGNRT